MATLLPGKALSRALLLPPASRSVFGPCASASHSDFGPAIGSSLGLAPRAFSTFPYRRTSRSIAYINANKITRHNGEKPKSEISKTATSNTRKRSFTSTSTRKMAATKYPSRDEIAARFEHLARGEYEKFFEHVSKDVDWTVMGTHPCAGHYTSLDSFFEHTLKRLGAIMKPPGIKLRVRNTIGGGDQEWAVVELIADAECKNGLDFDNTYAWCCRFDAETGKIVQVRAYLDSVLVQQAVVENECPSHRAPTGR